MHFRAWQGAALGRCIGELEQHLLLNMRCSTYRHPHWVFAFSLVIKASDEEKLVGKTETTCLGTEQKASNGGVRGGRAWMSSLLSRSGPCSLSCWILWLHKAPPGLESPFWAHGNIRWQGLNLRAGRHPGRGNLGMDGSLGSKSGTDVFWHSLWWRVNTPCNSVAKGEGEHKHDIVPVSALEFL